MRFFLILAVAFVTVFAGPSVRAEEAEQQYLTIKKNNHTTMIKIDPVTADILKKSMQNGNRIKITYPEPAIAQEKSKHCNSVCRRARRDAEKYGYLTGREIAD